MASTDPVKDAGDYMDKAMSYAERMAKAEFELETDFVKACLTKDALDMVDFHTQFDYTTKANRPAYVFEMMLETIAGNDDIATFVMQSLMLCARKGDPDAQAAIRKMAREFAKHNAYVEE